MHGILRPIADEDVVADKSALSSIADWAKRRRPFLLVVILPSLLVAAYYYLWAADQYATETHFIVRSSQNSPAGGTGLGAVFQLSGVSQAKTDAMSVIDYLDSTDAVLELNRRIDLVDRFRAPESDFVSQLSSSQPKSETLVKYYRKRVQMKFHEDSGITSVLVTSFRPTDSYAIAQTLLRMGEERVNILNDRSYKDSLAFSARQLSEAEAALQTAQVEITQFRSRNADVDPEGTGRAQTALVSQLTAGLAAARAQLNAMAGIVSPSSPQYVALAARVRALDAQVAQQAGRLSGQGSSVATRLGGYETLRVRQEFAAKRYELAAAAYQSAREDARKKRLYLVRVVNPNMAMKSLYPERFRIVITVFFSLLVAYAIGWLILAGVKEHAVD